MDSFIFEFWTHLLLQIVKSAKNIKQKANSVNLDETARQDPSHLDLHCLHKNRLRSAGLKRFIIFFP